MTGLGQHLRNLVPYGLALFIGLIGALIAVRIGFPLPWMLGPMIATMLAAVVGAPVKGPVRLRPFVLPILGVMLGSGFRPEVLDRVSSWPATLLMVPVYVAVAGGLSFLYFRKVMRYDPVTSYFCAMPGGLTEMLMFGHRAGGNDRQIALAHAARILIVVTSLAFFFYAVLGVRVAGSRTTIPISAFGFMDVFWLTLSGIIGAFMGRKLRLPGSLMTGPLILSAACHVAGLVHLPPPSAFVVLAQLVIGTVVGCRFIGVKPLDIGRQMIIGVGATGLMLGVSFTLASIIGAISDTHWSQALLALSPGGFNEMSLVALAMNQDIVYVTVTHLTRLTVVITVAPLGLRLVQRYLTTKPPPD